MYVEIIGTFGIAIMLAIHGFHHGFGYLFTTQGAEHAATNPLGLDFGGNWLLGAALVAVLAPVYIFYGFESAGDIAEETKDAGRQVPRAMRLALIWGGDRVVRADRPRCCSRCPSDAPVAATVTAAACRSSSASCPAAPGPPAAADHLRVLLLRHVDPGRRLPAGVLLRRDGALPGSRGSRGCTPRFRTPVNALIGGAVVTVLFVLLVFASPAHNMHISVHHLSRRTSTRWSRWCRSASAASTCRSC